MSVYILNLHHNDNHDTWEEKHIIYASAMDYKEYYDVKKPQRFSNRSSEFDKFMPIQMGSLTHVGLRDKLMIFGHGYGDLRGFGPYNDRDPQVNAIQLATDLHRWGLNACGVITFKVCFVGGGDFLDFLVGALCARHIEFGWVKGYTGAAATAPRHGLIGKPIENITRKVVPTHAPPGDLTRYRVLLFRGPNHAEVPRPTTHGELEV